MGGDHCEIIVCIRGRGKIRINNEPECMIQANQMLIVTPQTNYEYRPLDEMWEIAAVRFGCNLTLLMQFRLKLNKLTMINSPNRLLTLIDVLCRSEGDPRSRTLQTSEIIYSVLAEAKFQTAGIHRSVSNPQITIEKLVNYIFIHYASKPTLKELSRIFGYTSQHLNRLFKNELGFSIYQYILKVQLEQAAYLLEAGEMTVEQVAENVGMESRSFYRLFHKLYGVSPGEFRRSVTRRLDRSSS
ncbi:AraC family transcriptional regulator [Bacillus sp. 3255]|uniref:AraC family transcriptional regulator n=1 Tax=Bacillus sp. 3255 TaxID=2817904 RepID=UPI00286A0FD6|nr:AraC family transcriptional regulator [Bacillus sp. 3255]